MWGIKFLSGPLAGQILPLKTGSNRLGRAAHCEIPVNAPGVSKEHLEIMVTADRILINDLKSSNGTFLNGVRIKGALARPGDKVTLHNILFEVVPFQGSRALTLARPRVAPAPAAISPAFSPALTHEENSEPQQIHPQAPQNMQQHVQNLVQKSQDFLENVALPGVYNLPKIFEFKQVILGFIAIYILMVTLLAVIPMKQITSESIQNETQRRALTVARSLSAANEKIIRSNDLSNFSIDMLIREEGIVDVYVISKDGMILAPPERTGSAPKETGFARKIRGQPREFSEELPGGEIAAAVPILVFDPELQQNTAKAHAVVIYNPGSLAFDDGRAFSLFIQMLFIAALLGGLLFFFLYKLIEHPFKLLNSELDLALREGRDQAFISFNLPVLQNLLTNINSLLARAAVGSAPQQGLTGKGARDSEIFNLMQLMGYPCILISREESIVRLNPAFESLTGIPAEKIVGARVSEIPDPAMQQNFLHLMKLSQSNMSGLNSDNLELSGHLFTLHCQALVSVSGDIEYYLITISPTNNAEGGAA